MKAAYSILKNRPRLKISVSRESVCAGDDCESPHQKEIETYSFTDPVQLVKEIASGYLPKVAGKNHFWICRLNGQKIAKVSDSEIVPLAAEALFSDVNRMHFDYHSATD
jgi:hypothetical protein